MTKRHRRAAEFKTAGHAQLFDLMLQEHGVNFSQFSNILLASWLNSQSDEVIEEIDDEFHAVLEQPTYIIHRND